MRGESLNVDSTRRVQEALNQWLQTNDFCTSCVSQEHYMRFDDAADLEHLAFIQDHISREMDGEPVFLTKMHLQLSILNDFGYDYSALYFFLSLY